MIVLLIISKLFASPVLDLTKMDQLTPQKEFKCFTQMRKLIEHEQPKGGWRRKINPDMTVSFVRPTKTLSKWIRIEKKSELEVFKRQSPYDEMVVSFNKSCIGNMSVRKIANYNLKNAFTDFQLAELLSKNPKGLILSWSPGMNLSIEAIKHAQVTATTKKIPLTILLDPYANEEKAKKILKKNGLENIPLKKISSFELISRSVLLHFPNLVMYKNGEIVGPMVPGLLNSADYNFLVTKYLEKK